MSDGQQFKATEHLLMASQHLELSAKQYRDAATCYDAGNDEKAGHHAVVGRGELVLAEDHDKEASKLLAAENRK